jgi:hypothetical protein
LVVESRDYVHQVQEAMGIKARKRQIIDDELGYSIREPSGAYSSVFYTNLGGLSLQNTVFLDESSVDSVSCDGPTPSILESAPLTTKRDQVFMMAFAALHP